MDITADILTNKPINLQIGDHFIITVNKSGEILHFNSTLAVQRLYQGPRGVYFQSTNNIYRCPNSTSAIQQDYCVNASGQIMINTYQQLAIEGTYQLTVGKDGWIIESATSNITPKYENYKVNVYFELAKVYIDDDMSRFDDDTGLLIAQQIVDETVDLAWSIITTNAKQKARKDAAQTLANEIMANVLTNTMTHITKNKIKNEIKNETFDQKVRRTIHENPALHTLLSGIREQISDKIRYK